MMVFAGNPKRKFWELGLVNDASFAMLLWSIDGNTGALLAADDLIECTADLQTVYFRNLRFYPIRTEQCRLNDNIYFDSFEIIASYPNPHHRNKEQADAVQAS